MTHSSQGGAFPFIYFTNKNATVVQQCKGDINTYKVESDTHRSVCHNLNLLIHCNTEHSIRTGVACPTAKRLRIASGQIIPLPDLRLVNTENCIFFTIIKINLKF